MDTFKTPSYMSLQAVSNVRKFHPKAGPKNFVMKYARHIFDEKVRNEHARHCITVSTYETTRGPSCPYGRHF